MKGIVSIILGSLFLLGCANQAEYAKPQMPEMNAQYQQPEFNADLWLSFGSQDLHELLKAAFATNWDLANARQKLVAKKLATQLEQAKQGVSSSLSTSSSQSADLGDLSDKQRHNHKESLSFSARYEVDVWGKLSDQLEQKQLDIHLSEWDLESLKISISAQIIKEYLSYLSLKERIILEQEKLANNQANLDLYKLQYDAGVLLKKNWLEQKNQLKNQQEKVRNLLSEKADAQRNLALLTGQETWKELEPDLMLSDLNLPQVALNQPAVLINQRPDLKGAEAQIKKAFLGKLNAQKTRWPNLSISLSLSPADFYNLAERWTASLVESIGLTLYDSGAKALQVKQAEVTEKLAQMKYSQTVQTAVKEVQDRLSAYQRANNSYVYQQQSDAVTAQQTALVAFEYKAGVRTKMEWHTAENTELSAKQSLVSAKQQVLVAITSIYQANGVAPKL